MQICAKTFVWTIYWISSELEIKRQKRRISADHYYKDDDDDKESNLIHSWLFLYFESENQQRFLSSIFGSVSAAQRRGKNTRERNEFDLHIHTMDHHLARDSEPMTRWYGTLSVVVVGKVIRRNYPVGTVASIVETAQKYLLEFMVYMATWNSFQVSIYSSFYNVSRPSLSLSLGSWGDHRKVREVPSLRTMNVNLNLLSVSTEIATGCCNDRWFHAHQKNIRQMIKKIPIDLNRTRLYVDRDDP